MKARFEIIRNKENVMSDIFNWDYIPYKIGDKVIINGIIWKKVYTEKDLIKTCDYKWNGDYKVIDIIHYIKMEQIISQNYTHDCVIIQLKEI